MRWQLIESLICRDSFKKIEYTLGAMLKVIYARISNSESKFYHHVYLQKFVSQDYFLNRRNAQDCSSWHFLDTFPCLNSEIVFSRFLSSCFCGCFFLFTNCMQCGQCAFPADVSVGVWCDPGGPPNPGPHHNDEKRTAQILNSCELWKAVCKTVFFVGYFLQKYIAVGLEIDMASTVFFHLFEIQFVLVIHKLHAFVLPFAPKNIFTIYSSLWIHSQNDNFFGLKNFNMFMSEKYI